MVFRYIKALPLAHWLKWVYRTVKLNKRYPSVYVGEYAYVEGDSTLGHKNMIHHHSMVYNSSLGDYTYIGAYSKVSRATIGKYCSIASGVRIGLGLHPTNLEYTHPAFYSPNSPYKDEIQPNIPDGLEEYKPVIIGDDVWLGTNSIVLDGVTIGNHAIVAAGAVVTKDVPPYAIIGGVPAKVIKYREVSH